jgi:hypothetical protein
MSTTSPNNLSSRSSFLKEMGITEWTDRSSNAPVKDALVTPSVQPNSVVESPAKTSEYLPEVNGRWIFIGTKPQGDALTLFQNIVRVLGLPSSAWSLQDQKINLDAVLGASTTPVVAIAFGAATAQRLSGENAPLTELRGSIHALMHGEHEIPLIATMELAQVLARPQEKALLWEDLLLARSVLQSL